jgi:hypothetical protein
MNAQAYDFSKLFSTKNPYITFITVVSQPLTAFLSGIERKNQAMVYARLVDMLHLFLEMTILSYISIFKNAGRMSR